MRFLHAQRSGILRFSQLGLVFQGKRWKCRKLGQVAPPFEWAHPVSSLLFKATLRRFFALWQRFVPREASFFVPALFPPHVSLTDATSYFTVPHKGQRLEVCPARYCCK